jgi:aminoglycoside 3-N-acetyltransferase
MRYADPAVAVDRNHIVSDLSALKLAYGRAILVHCSMRQIGHIVGGPATLLDALFEVIGPYATVVVPTQTANNSNSSPVFRAATRGMSPAQLAAYVERMAGFDVAGTPSFGMGAFAEYVRQLPDAVRSSHPQSSFAAVGPDAKELMAIHDLNCHLGERSPVAALYKAEADTLLIGVGYEACTVLHLAEYRLPGPAPVRLHRCFVNTNGKRISQEFRALHLDAEPFGRLGADIDREPFVKSGLVGRAPSKVLPVRAAVDFAVTWMADHCRT